MPLHSFNAPHLTNAGLDVKTHTGSVVTPPSVHVSGRRYRWVDPDLEIAPAPRWLVTRLTRTSLPRPE